MSEPSPAATLLFLRDEELRAAFELLFFAERDLAAEADALLAEHGLSRTQHRILHFVGRHPQMTVSDLLGILKITKQSLSRLIGELIDQGWLAQRAGQRDRRQRQLALTETGLALEKALWERQRGRIAQAYREAGAQAVEGCRRVLTGLVDAGDRRRFERPAPLGGLR